MSASVDPLDKVMFETEDMAIEHCKRHGFDGVVKITDPSYAHKPYICVKLVGSDDDLPEDAIVGKVVDHED